MAQYNIRLLLTPDHLTLYNLRHHAAGFGNMAAVDVLLANGADPTQLDRVNERWGRGAGRRETRKDDLVDDLVE
eukprot:480876-Hanusia_phi.AAC.1